MNKVQPSRNWKLDETSFNPQEQHHKETIFTIGNGYLSTRGTFEERFFLDRQATLVHGMWDNIPIVFTELANAPDWTSIEIWIDGIRFDMGSGVITDYNRCLHLDSGILSRELHWSPDNGNTIVLLEFERFASLADQHILAIQLKITPISSNCKVRIRASIDKHVENEGYLHWNINHQNTNLEQVDMVLTTRRTKKTVAMSARFNLKGGQATSLTNDTPGYPGLEFLVRVKQGEVLTLEKIVGLGTSRDSENPSQFSQAKAYHGAKAGYHQLSIAHKAAWADFWAESDVVIEGDDEAQVAIRHALFQLRIAAPINDEHVSIGAKSLSGFGYRGHVFWDTEIFILPFFVLTQPNIARNLLKYRYLTLPGARRKAAGNGYKGAQYAWESAETGDEVTPTWVPDFKNPLQLVRIWTGDIEIHISTDIAYAQNQYWQITGDDDFWIDFGIPILLETAIFWGDRAEEENGHFSYRNVIGPDEYHEHVDNNAYTNRMAKWHLETALSTLAWLNERFPQRAAQFYQDLDIDSTRLEHWANIRDNIVIHQDPETKLIEQFEGFFELEDLDWSLFEGRKQSMQEILGIQGANQSQVIKQADVILLLCLLHNEFDQITWQTNWEYYNPRTDHSHGSSLGPAMQSLAACKINQPDLAYEHFMRAARADLYDIRGNAIDGIHAASAGGLWQGVAFGFAGLHFTENKPQINPRLPSKWKRLSFPFIYQGVRYQVEINSTGYKILQRKA